MTLWTLFGAELRLALRTREVWLYLLAPAMLFLPTVVFIASFVMTLQPAEQVRIDVPESLVSPLTEELWEGKLAAVSDSEPHTAVSRGYSGGVHTEDGIRWQVWTAEDWPRARVQSAIKRVHRHQVEAALGGPEAMTDLPVPRGPETTVTYIQTEKSETDTTMARFVLTVLTLITAIYTLPAQLIHDRSNGVLESLLATRSALWPALAAKVLAFSVLQVLAVALFTLSLLAFVPELHLLRPSVLDLVAIGTVLLASNAMVVAVASQAKTVMSAWNGGALLLLGLVAPVLIDVPWFIPVIGLFDAAGAVEVLGGALLTSLGAAAAIYGSAHLTLQRGLFFGEVNG